jgi:hypothetical protein
MILQETILEIESDSLLILVHSDCNSNESDHPLDQKYYSLALIIHFHQKQKKVSSRYDFSTLLKNGCARTLDFARSRTVIATGNLIDFVAYPNSMESSSIMHIPKVEFKCGSLSLSSFHTHTIIKL